MKSSILERDTEKILRILGITKNLESFSKIENRKNI